MDPRPLILPVVLAFALVLAPPLSANAGSPQGDLFTRVNRARESHGFKDLKLSVDLSAVALRHSRRMAKRHKLFHTPNLAGKLSPHRWNIAGENVGMARTLKRLMEMWMGSAEHRANILRRSYHHIGVGVVRVKGYFWATLIFYG
jgi:uncharacterized protein YkwD